MLINLTTHHCFYCILIHIDWKLTKHCVNQNSLNAEDE